MLVKAKAITPKPVVKELDEVELTLNSNDAYLLVGILGAQTDSASERLYNGLTRAIAAETGEVAPLIIKRNSIANAASKRANETRVYGGNSDKHLEFVYDGLVRTVINPVIEGRNGLLKGFEMTRGQAPSEQFKSYRLSKIGR